MERLVPISAIRVGERHRKDMGDIDALAASIENVGLLQPIVELTNQSTLLHAPVGAHSQKPEAFYELVEKLCPAPRYAELFARSCRPNWDGHGDELPADSP